MFYFGCNTILSKAISLGILNSIAVIQNVVEAFHSIHELGVLHRDVRKENILVREDELVIIIEFDRSVFNDVSHDEIIAECEVVRSLLVELQGRRCGRTVLTSCISIIARHQKNPLNLLISTYVKQHWGTEQPPVSTNIFAESLLEKAS